MRFLTKYLIAFICVGLFSIESFAANNDQQQSGQKSEQEAENKPQIKPKYIKKEKKEDDSLIGSLSKTVTDAVGMLSLDGRTEGEEGVPRKIAVLPAVPTGDPVEERELDDIRTAIHNNLSSKNFDLLKPFDIDRMLAQFELADGKNHRDYDPKALADKLGVEGLVYVDVPLVEQVYAAAYAHYKITIKLNFYSAIDDTYIWEKEESIAEREGGISLNPLSFIAQAISSAQVLTEAVRQTLVDKLARIFAAEIPFPIGSRKKIKPVKIDLAISNVAEGPFRAGDEVSVFMRAESGLAANFDIGNKYKGFPLVEQGEGEYVGRYVVSEGDSTAGAIVRINAKRIDDAASIVWRVPGRVGIDTQAPEAIKDLQSVPVKDAIKLTWQAQSTSTETLTYHIQRADPQTGIYQDLVAINIQEYIDTEIVEGNKYHYRLYAQDEAKNQSPFSNIQVSAVGAGPTPVTDDIIGDSTFHAVASPYIIDKHIRVLRNATLTLSPGAIVKFEGEGKLEVLGTVSALGTSEAPIAFSGDNVQLLFTNTGQNQSKFGFSQFSPENNSQSIIDVNQSSVHFNQTSFKGIGQGLVLRNRSNVEINNSEFIENQVGLKVEDGDVTLSAVKFIANQLAWDIAGRQNLSNQALDFEDNDIHIRSDRPITITNAIFNDSDFESLLEKLDGPIKVDFSNLADKNNLLNAWLKKRWVDLLAAANNGLWQESYDELQQIREHTTNERIENFNQTLKLVTGQTIDQSNQFIRTVKRFDKSNEQGKLWVQEVKLPYSQNTANSDAYIEKQALKKLTRDYLKQNFDGLKASEIRKYKRKVKIDKNTIGSQVVYTMKKGLFLNVWVAHYLDMGKINRSLTTAGLLQKQNSELMVGLLSEADIFALEDTLIKALEKQGIKYISLGTGSYGKPAHARAVKNGANIVLETQVISEENTSGISDNVKMADVNLIISLYDVETNQKLRRLTASSNKAGFKLRDIVKKAVVESYATLDTKLMTALWEADDVVIEHKKRSEERKRLAKIKAERERKLQAEREKKRKAELERKRLAKLEREKAAKEKAAKEKAARKLAAKQEAERIAKAKEDAQKQAKEQQLAKAKADEQSQQLEKVKAQLAKNEAKQLDDNGKGQQSPAAKANTSVDINP